MVKEDTFWNGQASQASGRAPKADYDYLLHRVEKLTLVNRALWEILKEYHDCPDDKLVAKVAEIDLRDGHLDHELKRPVISCPECGHKINARHDHCLYCGFDQLPEDVFTSVS